MAVEAVIVRNRPDILGSGETIKMPTTLTIEWGQWVVGVILLGLLSGIGNAIGSQIGIRLHGKIDKVMKWVSRVFKETPKRRLLDAD